VTERRIRARVTGKVQGVGFRYFTWSVGRNLGLAGFVRNEPDGAVVLEAEGSAAAIAQLLVQVGRGPAHARVEHTQVEELPLTGTRGAFEVG
jgi:acylphosphatase